jgi:hypothetical protein
MGEAPSVEEEGEGEQRYDGAEGRELGSALAGNAVDMEDRTEGRPWSRE